MDRYIGMVKKILVPHDGSENAKRGLEAAVSLAKQHGAEVTAVHVQSTGKHTEFAGYETTEKLPDLHTQAFMKEAVSDVVRDGVVLNITIMRGDAGYNIVKLAKDGGFDLIVLTPSGKNAVRKAIFGSVAKYVVEASKIPVHIVE